MASRARPPLIACSLDATDQQARLNQWRDLLGEALSREQTFDGVRYTFAAGMPEQRLRDLAAAEQVCCSFLKFDITREADQVCMNVAAPPDARDALRLIFPA